MCLTLLALAAGLALPSLGAAQELPGIISQPLENGGQRWSLSLQTLLLLSSLAFLPAALLMMTCFTRIIIVLGLLRTAMGTQATPPNQVLLGLALFLTFFIMAPVFSQVHELAWVPLTN
ncbi:MAG TPA: flagellar biosynthetic protein FliP, partial [Halomonas sp.]|nr:flagellar biosynthetic protein FliP [Halomonas sp.]